MKEKFMQEAYKEAQIAMKQNEVPVGAIIVLDGKIIARGHNKKEKKNNALLHAEIVAIEKACKKQKSWRLTDCELYVTLEPCPMCAGAIINSRLKAVHFGAYDPKSGACGSVVNLVQNKAFNHNPQVTGGTMEAECGALLSDFFRKKREKAKE